MTRPALNPARRHLLWLTIGLAVITSVIYLPALQNDFVDWDDPIYITSNPHVLSGLSTANVLYALTTFDSHNWIPLTWLSYQFDATLFGQSPAAFHAANVFWHVANVVLLCVLLHRMTASLYRSAAVALLFAVHPLHVESVAWVSERKDLLSTCALLLTLLAYHRYVLKPTRMKYALVAILMTIGLLAKSMLVTTPFLLLLIDFWPLRRFPFQQQESESGSRGIATLLWEKVPLVAISFADGLVTLAAQQTAMSGSVAIPLPNRIANALDAVRWYLWKTIWPVDLYAFYQHPLDSVSVPAAVLSGFLVVGLTAIAVVQCRKSPHQLFGWGWFLVSLLPVIGLIQVGTQAHADRYAYVPHLGLFTAVVWEISARLQGRVIGRRIGFALVAIATGLCAIVTTSQIRTWRNTQSLWTRAIQLDPYNAMAHLQIGRIAVMNQQWATARDHYSAVMIFRPSDADAILNLGFICQQQGQPQLAAEYYSWMLRLSPRHPIASHNLQSLPPGSLVLSEPSSPAVSEHRRRGLTMARQGQMEQALRYFQQAADLDPHDALSQNLAATALEETRRFDEALRYYQRALEARPTDVEAMHGVDRIRKRSHDSLHGRSEQ